MAIIVQGTIPAAEFVLAETLTALPTAVFKCERLVISGDKAVMPLLWVNDGEAEEVSQALAADPTVETVELLSTVDGEHLYRMEWIGQIDLILQMLTSSKATIMDASGTGEQWFFRILYPSRDALSQTTEFGEEHGLTFDITTIRELDGEPAGRYGLTEAQYEALAQAVESGYYNIPRENNLEDVAAALDISHQALSERIRRATLALIEDTILIEPSQRPSSDSSPSRAKNPE